MFTVPQRVTGAERQGSHWRYGQPRCECSIFFVGFPGSVGVRRTIGHASSPVSPACFFLPRFQQVQGVHPKFLSAAQVIDMTVADVDDESGVQDCDGFFSVVS